jgi:DNA replication and repair protein RecF
MSLIELTAENLRCVRRVELELHPRHNLVWGSNGSGKTSLLEAIFLLGRGRSFRTRNSERLIRHGESHLTVFGRTDGVAPQKLGVQVSRSDGTVARINGSVPAALTELSQTFPVQVIDPGIHKLLEEGAHRRRRWLDWVVFHVEPTFADQWMRYARVLKQRNAALRTEPAQAGSAAWDMELVRLGELICASRCSVFDRLEPAWRAMVLSLSGLQVDLHYSRGWPQGVPLGQALIDSRTRDLVRGLTHSGPHRADVVLRLAGKPAREVLSRGQQKLVAIAMTLAQLQLLRDLTGLNPTLLLDDPAAELDREHLLKFIGHVQQLECQLVLTALHAQSSLFGTPERVFHVEQGGVGPV